jgi:hypothetical protein
MFDTVNDLAGQSVSKHEWSARAVVTVCCRYTVEMMPKNMIQPRTEILMDAAGEKNYGPIVRETHHCHDLIGVVRHGLNAPNDPSSVERPIGSP